MEILDVKERMYDQEQALCWQQCTTGGFYKAHKELERV